MTAPGVTRCSVPARAQSAKAKVNFFVQNTFDIEVRETKMAAKGWNWGEANFHGARRLYLEHSHLTFTRKLFP